MPRSTATMVALASNTETTTSWVGTMAVRPVRTRKVTSADNSARTTTAGARYPLKVRGGRGKGGEMATGGDFATDSDIRSPSKPAGIGGTDAFLQHWCKNVTDSARRRHRVPRSINGRCGSPEHRDRGSSCARYCG